MVISVTVINNWLFLQSEPIAMFRSLPQYTKPLRVILVNMNNYAIF